VRGAVGRVSRTFRIRNEGEKAILRPAFSVLVSDDPLLDENDLLVKKQDSVKIRGAKATKLKIKIKLPKGFKLSGRYLIGVVDSNNAVAEKNEANTVVVYGPLR
jgi:hypothetical protein